MIDNSYATPLFQNVMAMGVDLSMQTATKYIGGHSDTVGGVLSGSKSMIKKIFASEYLNIGSGIQPFNAWLLIRGLRTLPARLGTDRQNHHRSYQVPEATFQRLKKSSIRLMKRFPQFELAKKQMKGAAGLLTIVLKTKKMESIVKFCESLKHIMMAVSWGGHESLVIPKCASIPEKDFDPSKKEHRYVRMYIGLEDADYLIKDLRAER